MNKTFEVYSHKEVYEWAAKIAKEYNKSKDYIQIFNNREFSYTICCNLKTGKIGKSKCHSDDTFSYTIGIAYAYARLMNLPEPKLVEKAYYLEECIGKTVMVSNISYYVIGCESNKNHVVVEKLSDHSLSWLYSWDKVKSSQIKYADRL